MVAVPLIFKRLVQNKPYSWFTLGYIESLRNGSSSSDDDNQDITPLHKLQEYHDTLKHIFKELVDI